jgi:CRP-like cAMP-binding protein
MGTSDALRRYPLFAVLRPDSISDWLTTGRSRRVELGETLFQAGTPARHAYFVEAGRVRVARAAQAGREVVLGTFGPGELFGEYGLLPPGLNTATCRAAGAARVLELPLEPLRAAVAEQPDVHTHLKRWLRLHGVLGHLRDCSFLGFMSATSLLPFLDRFSTKGFSPGQTLQAEGLSTDAWFVVLKGQVRLGGTPDLLGPGDCFGEGALLGWKDLPLAEAQSDTECMVLRREAFYGRLDASRSGSLQTRVGELPTETYPWVGQREAVDCGLASLAMVARFHGLNVPPESLRQGIHPGPRGLSLLAVQLAATLLGLCSRPVRIDPMQLSDVALPAVAHMSGDHYVVVYAIFATTVVMGDPAAGVVTVSTSAFRKSWTGHLLLLAPEIKRDHLLDSGTRDR